MVSSSSSSSSSSDDEDDDESEDDDDDAEDADNGDSGSVVDVVAAASFILNNGDTDRDLDLFGDCECDGVGDGVCLRCVDMVDELERVSSDGNGSSLSNVGNV